MLTGCCYIFIDCNKFWCKDIDVTHCLWDVLFFMLAETPPPEEDLSSWSEEKQPEPVVEALPDDRNDTIAEVHKETSCHPEVRAALIDCYYNCVIAGIVLVKTSFVSK